LGRHRVPIAGEPGDGMLELVREYALERLEHSGVVEGNQRQHAT
jgi:hypothetical protein